MPAKTITANACMKIVEAASQPCHVQVAASPAIATGVSAGDGLASLSTAFTYGSMALAVLVLIAGYGWAKFVAHEAKEMAKADAKTYIDDWLADKAAGIIRQRVDFIIDATLGSGSDDKAADDLGEHAG
jgi:hypothetical protein